MTVCDDESIPTTFSLSCGFNGPVFPLWNVTGLSMGRSKTLSRGKSVDGYLSYPQPSASFARLNVDLTSRMQVIEGTCFQCVLDLIGGRIVSEKGCIRVVGGLLACFGKVCCLVNLYIYFRRAVFVCWQTPPAACMRSTLNSGLLRGATRGVP